MESSSNEKTFVELRAPIFSLIAFSFKFSNGNDAIDWIGAPIRHLWNKFTFLLSSFDHVPTMKTAISFIWSSLNIGIRKFNEKVDPWYN